MKKLALLLGMTTLAFAAMETITAGTSIVVRTDQTIDARRNDGLVFTGTVDQDVRASNGDVAIPRGSSVELLVKSASKNELVLDLESVTVNGRRYALDAAVDRISEGRKDGVGENRRTAKYVGGTAVLGTIIGAIAGGGKGAAIGALAGGAAGAGVQTISRGRTVHVPAESIVTFRLDRALSVVEHDNGYDRDGRHYHGQRRDR